MISSICSELETSKINPFFWGGGAGEANQVPVLGNDDVVGQGKRYFADITLYFADITLYFADITLYFAEVHLPIWAAAPCHATGHAHGSP